MVTALLVAAAVATSGPAELEQLKQLEQRVAGTLAVAVLDSNTGIRIEERPNERFLMCSTFKLLAAAAVLQRVDRGQEQLSRFIPYTTADLLDYAPVTKQHVAEGGMQLGALCAAAIEQSDNTAGNLLVKSIGGPQAFTAFARAIGDPVTRLDRAEPELNNLVRGDERDTTTSRAMLENMVRLFTTDVLSSQSRQQLQEWLTTSETGADMIRAAVPAGWKVGDKTGRSSDGATNDIAIVWPPGGKPIFISIYARLPNTPSQERSAVIASAAKIVISALSR